MRARLKLMLGVALVLAGVILMVISITPKPVPPVTFLWNQSGFVNENGVYFDSIAIHNYGSSNVTVVVVIEDLIDTHPRVSDPITLCPSCTSTVQIEATQPPPNLSYDQLSLYTKQLSNPESYNVEYLSTVLQSKFDNYVTTGGAFTILLGVFIMARSLRPKSSRGRKVKRSRGKSHT